MSRVGIVKYTVLIGYTNEFGKKIEKVGTYQALTISELLRRVRNEFPNAHKIIPRQIS